MTYAQLLKKLQKLDSGQLACDVTIWDKHQDEYYPCPNLLISEVADILDKKHPFLVFDADMLV